MIISTDISREIFSIDMLRDLRPVLLVVQVMSDISKQDCIHKRIPQYTELHSAY